MKQTPGLTADAFGDSSWRIGVLPGVGPCGATDGNPRYPNLPLSILITFLLAVAFLPKGRGGIGMNMFGEFKRAPALGVCR